MEGVSIDDAANGTATTWFGIAVDGLYNTLYIGVIASVLPIISLV